MKKSLFVFLLLITHYSLLIAQSGWVRVSDSIPNLVIMSMQFTSENTGYAVGSYGTTFPGGFLRTTNAGLNWQFTNFPNYSADDICFLNDNTGYISSWYVNTFRSYVLKTTNSGNNWISKDSLPVSFFKMKFYDLNTGFVASKYSTIHKTTNGGSNWIAQAGVNWMEPFCIWCFDADYWLITDKSYNLNKTTNGGVNWIVLNFEDIGFLSSSLYFINSNTGFSATHNGNIFKTTNKGDNWFQISSINQFYVDGNIFFVNDNTGYVCGYGTYGNVYKTTNAGINWTPQTTNPFIPYNTLTYIFFTNSNTGYTGGYNGIIYKTTNGGVFVNNISNNIPDKFSLYQNYPNPFNPTTKIKFDIPSEGKSLKAKVKIVIYDILGKEIQTLVNEKLNPGTYEVTFDGSNFSSGVYFYQLRSGEFIETKKLVLLK